MNILLTGKTAVVTAGAGATGRAVCATFADAGAGVAVCDRDLAAARKYAEELRKDGADAEGFEVNPGKRAEMSLAYEAIVNRFGKIDILVNNENAELLPEELAPLHEFDIDRCADIIDEGIKSFYSFSQLCMQNMAMRKNGSIVNIVSIRGLVPTANNTPIVAVAAAVIGLTKMWGVELKDEKIRVNAIAAGVLDPDYDMESRRCSITQAGVAGDGLHAQYGDAKNVQGAQSGGAGDVSGAASDTREDIPRRFAHLAIQRPAEPEELASAALFLASGAASYITGAVLPVDGGLSAGYVRSF